jgi:putative flippase GtrA
MKWNSSVSLIFENITSFYTNNPKEVRRFAKFALVGALGAIIDFTLLNLLRGYVGWPLLFANTVSVSVAIVSNFVWNRLWTYPESRVRKKRVQLPQFALVNFIGLVINNLIVLGLDSILVTIIGEPFSYNVAKLAAIGVVLLWNFGVNRLWTYKGL